MSEGRQRAGTVLHRLVERTEALSALDPVADAIAPAADAAIRAARAKELLSGTPIGHPLHPLLTDVVIGAWTMALILDLGDDDQLGAGADRLVGVGLLAAAPTALAGLSDWSDMTGPRSRRSGLVHAASNATALALYGASALARRAGRRRLGRGLAAGGALALGAGGYIGAHLTYVRGVGVSRTAFDEGVVDWTPVEPASAGAPGGQPRLGALRLLLRDGDGDGEGVARGAVGGICTHCGAPLRPDGDGGGDAACGGCGSGFRADDGAVVRGPATTPLPVYELRAGERGLEGRSPPP